MKEFEFGAGALEPAPRSGSEESHWPVDPGLKCQTFLEQFGSPSARTSNSLIAAFSCPSIPLLYFPTPHVSKQNKQELASSEQDHKYISLVHAYEQKYISTGTIHPCLIYFSSQLGQFIDHSCNSFGSL